MSDSRSQQHQGRAMGTPDEVEGAATETDPLVNLSYTRPLLVQKGRTVGCFVIFLLVVVGAITIGVGLGFGVGFGTKKVTEDTLPHKITVRHLMNHLKDLQDIADSSPMKSRSVENGYNASAEMVFDKLKSMNYDPVRQHFSVPIFVDEGNANFSGVVTDFNYTWHFLLGAEFSVMRYSGSSDVNAALQPVNGTGCTEEEYDNFIAGSVALLSYTTSENCSLYDKAALAEEKGAAAVVMRREEASTVTSGPPTSRVYERAQGGGFSVVNVSVLGTTYQLGQDLFDLFSLAQERGGELTVTIQTATSVTMHDTYNVLACTPDGKDDSIIVIGSHLDSVPAGAGINDNGSGSMANLEIALQVARLQARPINKVLFAFWGAEELGLLGSHHFVDELTEQERSNIALNLNFDMLGSPNYVRKVYNGSMADEKILNASTKIMELFEKRFRDHKLDYELTPFNGRSDYGPFIEVDIPAGGVATGAEEKKSEDQRKLYGGFANAQMDTCYHQECDTYDNIDSAVYLQMAQAAADVLNTLMMKGNLREYLNNSTIPLL